MVGHVVMILHEGLIATSCMPMQRWLPKLLFAELDSHLTTTQNEKERGAPQ